MTALFYLGSTPAVVVERRLNPDNVLDCGSSSVHYLTTPCRTVAEPHRSQRIAISVGSFSVRIDPPAMIAGCTCRALARFITAMAVGRNSYSRFPRFGSIDGAPVVKLARKFTRLCGSSRPLVVEQARRRGLLSDDHFSVDGTLIQAWASIKSLRLTGSDPALNPAAASDFHRRRPSGGSASVTRL